MTEWQPIETAPKDGTVIDLWISDDDWRAANCSWIDGQWVMEEEGTIIENPTHWMPIPKGPS